MKARRKMPKKRVKIDSVKHERGETKKKEKMEHLFGGHVDGKKKPTKKKALKRKKK